MFLWISKFFLVFVSKPGERPAKCASAVRYSAWTSSNNRALSQPWRPQ